MGCKERERLKEELVHVELGKAPDEYRDVSEDIAVVGSWIASVAGSSFVEKLQKILTP